MALIEIIPQLRLEDIMAKHVIFINAEDSVAFVVKMFERARISGAPVVDPQGKYVGVISKTDLLRNDVLEKIIQNASNPDAECLKVKHFMCPTPPISVPSNTTIKKVTEVMVQKRIHRIFVKDHVGIIVGVVSSLDVMKALAS